MLYIIIFKLSFLLTNKPKCAIFLALFQTKYAGMAELADALDSGSNGRKAMQVQVLLPAPNSINPNLLIVGDGFGFIVFEEYPNLTKN